MADPRPVLRGENLPVTVFVNNVPQRVSDLVKSIKISESAVQHRDQYLGRNRARTDKQVDGYDVSIEMDYSDSVLLDALLAQEAARAANQPVPKITIMALMQNRDGSTNSYYVDNLQAKFELNAGGRTDSVTQSMELQGENLVKVG